MQSNTLTQRGWEIHRIWSIDWYENKDKEIEKLLNKIV
ncbi:hypothetical protein [Staphylococcus sp. Marseille-Q6910]